MRKMLATSALSTLLLAGCLDEPTGSGCRQVPTLVTETRGDTVITVTGLRYIETQAGAGATAESCQQVSVNYAGYLTDGTLFDESDEAFAFFPGFGQVIPGFEQGVVGMKVGGQRRVIIPPALGYGNQQQGPIPPNSTLIFDIELVAADQ